MVRRWDLLKLGTRVVIKGMGDGTIIDWETNDRNEIIGYRIKPDNDIFHFVIAADHDFEILS